MNPVREDAVIIKEEHTGVCTVTYTIHTLLVELVFTVYDSYVGSMKTWRARAKFSGVRVPARSCDCMILCILNESRHTYAYYELVLYTRRVVCICIEYAYA